MVFSGIWVEAPLLINKLPEGWKIPSMILAVSQLAQVGPVLLFFLKCKCVSCFKKQKFAKTLRRFEVSDRFIIYFLFLIGLLAGCMIAVYWNQTAFIFGEERSIAFFCCVFCLAILDCTCTIVFLTYIGKFKGNYITGLYIGEGISSLLPSVFALLQGMGDDSTDTKNCPINTMNANTTTSIPSHSLNQPRFSVSAYFWLLFSTLVVSFLAFLILEFWPGFKKEKINYNSELKNKKNDYALYKEDKEFEDYTLVNEGLLNRIEILSNGPKIIPKEEKSSDLDKFVLLGGISLVSFTLYGFLPGLSSYSALPYGPDIMHLCSTLCNLKIFNYVFLSFKSFYVTLLSVNHTAYKLFDCNICDSSFD